MFKVLLFFILAILIINCDTTNVSNSKELDNNDTTYYRLSKQQNYYEDGELRTTWFYEYKDDKLISTSAYNSTNDFLYSNKNEFDENGKKVIKLNYGSDDLLNSYFTYEYDGLEIIRKDYRSDSILFGSGIYNLNSSGDVTESYLSLSEDGGDTTSISYFTYDSKNRRTGRVRINSDGDTTGLTEFFYTGDLLDSCVTTDLPSNIVGVRKFYYEEGKNNENIFIFGLW